MWRLENASSNNGSVIQRQQIKYHYFTTPPQGHKPPVEKSGEMGLAGASVLLWWLPEKKHLPLPESALSWRSWQTHWALLYFSPQLHTTNHQGFSWCHRIVINQQTPAKYMTVEFTCKESCEIFECLSFRSNHLKNNSWWMFKLSPIFAHLTWQKQGCFWNAS